MKRLIKFTGLAVILGITLWVAHFFYQHYRFVITDNAFQMADVISVSTQDVSGKVKALYKKEFEEVKRGEPLFKIDDRVYAKNVKALEASIRALKAEKERLEKQLERVKVEIPATYRATESSYIGALKEAEALEKELKNAQVAYKTAVESARARVRALTEKVKAARENYERMKNRYERFKRLYEKRVISRQQFEDVRAAYYGAKAELAGAQAQLKAAKEELKRAQAGRFKVEALKEKLKATRERALALKEKSTATKAQLKRIEELKKAIEGINAKIKAQKARLEKAKILLSHTLVNSPVEGLIAKKWRNKGEFVSPGLPVYSIYDPRTFYVLAWIEEDKIRFFKTGSRAKVELETCKEEFEGEVFSIGTSAGSIFALIPRDTSQGEYTRVVQRIPVKIRLESVPLRCIKPGSNATVYIKKG